MASEGQQAEAPPLLTRTKMAYGVGQLSDGIRASGFGLYLFFYYVQVLGLPPELGGTAIFIAVLFDAFTDPIAGYISDAWKSRWGRRHPFMYASAIPSGICFYFTFVPPAGLSETGLFWWLLGVSILTRLAMTIFVVPHYALGAELSEEGKERTSVVSIRYAFFSAGSLLAYAAAAVFFGPGPEGGDGRLIASNYPPFALVGALIMVVSILFTAVGTHHRIPYLVGAEQTPVAKNRVLGVFTELWSALQNRNFRFVSLGALMDALMLGAQLNLMLFVYTFFWELSTDLMTLAFVGFGVGQLLGTIFLAGPVSARFERRQVAIFGAVWYMLFTIVPVALRLIGWFPENGTEALPIVLITLNVIGAMGVVVGYVAQGAMIADVTDEHELSTGKRQEGMFYAALSFVGKAPVGIGSMISGFGLWLIAWPQGENIKSGADIPPETLFQLGILYGPALAIMGMVGIFFYSRYRLDRGVHAEMQAELALRRAATEPTPPAPGSG